MRTPLDSEVQEEHSERRRRFNEVKRVVTGMRHDGTSYVVSEGSPPCVLRAEGMPEMQVEYVWTTDSTPSAPNEGTDATRLDQDFYPGTTGSRFIVNTYPPGFGAKPALQSGAQGESDGPALEHLLMHATQTIDYAVVLEGTMTMVLDSGEEVTLQPFDTVVQNGTNHGWRNSSGATVVMAFVIIGAQPHV
jgi:hypothetical protein